MRWLINTSTNQIIFFFECRHQLDQALQQLKSCSSCGDSWNSLAKNLHENLSPKDQNKLRELIRKLRDFFGERRKSSPTGDGGTSREPLDTIFGEDEHPILQLELLLSLERFLCSSSSRWGASGSPVISTKVRGGALVGMFLRGFPGSAENGADFLVEQAVKLPKFQVEVVEEEVEVEEEEEAEVEEVDD